MVQDLRTRLETLANQAGIRVKGYYVMPIKSGRIANAMVSGLFQKRIILTDYLLENMTPDEVRTILAHEIGHVKRWHLWIRSALPLLWLGLMAGAAYATNRYAVDAPTWVIVVAVIAFGFLYFNIVSKKISRIQEQQADEYVLKMGLSGETFIGALLKLAKLNVAPTRLNKLDQKFQTHPSVAKRVQHIASKAQLSDERVQEITDAL